MLRRGKNTKNQCKQSLIWSVSFPNPSVPKQNICFHKDLSCCFASSINSLSCLWDVTHWLCCSFPASNTVYTTVMSAARPDRYQTWMRTGEWRAGRGRGVSGICTYSTISAAESLGDKALQWHSGDPVWIPDSACLLPLDKYLPLLF